MKTLENILVVIDGGDQICITPEEIKLLGQYAKKINESLKSDKNEDAEFKENFDGLVCKHLVWKPTSVFFVSARGESVIKVLKKRKFIS